MQLDFLIQDWHSVFHGAVIDAANIKIWATPRSRFAMSLIAGSVLDPENPPSRRKGFFVAHYCFLRPCHQKVNHKKLRKWQSLSLFIAGDASDAERILRDLSIGIGMSMEARCDAKYIERCPDPIFHEPLSRMWSPRLTDSLPIVLGRSQIRAIP